MTCTKSLPRCTVVHPTTILHHHHPHHCHSFWFGGPAFPHIPSSSSKVSVHKVHIARANQGNPLSPPARGDWRGEELASTSFVAGFGLASVLPLLLLPLLVVVVVVLVLLLLVASLQLVVKVLSPQSSQLRGRLQEGKCSGN